MGRSKIEISRELLEKLYIEQRLSPYAIGNQLKCSFSTVTNRMKEFGIPFRSPAEARMRYLKNPFTGSVEEKSYMHGFALGDLSVYVPGLQSATLVARCHTTQHEQVTVFKEMFKNYGHVNVSISKDRRNIHMNTYLDLPTFSFLLDIKKKTVPKWVTHSIGWPFFAGYNDAEGNLIINQGRARLKIDAYDYRVLLWLNSFLHKEGIHTKMRKIGIKGVLRSDGTYFNKNLWRLNVNEASSLEKLILNALPYTKHEIRRQGLIKCLENITLRKQRRGL